MDYLIETNFTGPNFVMVPNSVAQDAALSPEALGVLVYLASLPRGFIARVSVIRDRFGIGKEKWQRIARELRAAGAMTVEPLRGPGGKVYGKRTVITWPGASETTEGRETRLSDRRPGKPADGKPAKQGRETRQTGPRNPAPYKDQRIKKGPAALSVDLEKSRDGKRSAAAPVAVDVGKLLRFQIIALSQGNEAAGVKRGTVQIVQAQAAAKAWLDAETEARRADREKTLRNGASCDPARV